MWGEDTSLGGEWNPLEPGIAEEHWDAGLLPTAPSSLATASTPICPTYRSRAENHGDVGFGWPLGVHVLVLHLLPMNKETSLRQ